MRSIFLVLFFLFVTPAVACQDQAIKLIRPIPEANRIWNDYPDKKDFMQWFSCKPDEMFQDILSAVHETAHGLRPIKGDKFPLVDGTWVKAPRADGFGTVHPLVWPVVKSLVADDPYVESYINPNTPQVASSSTYYTYLLDELNAYTHDVAVGEQLSKAMPQEFPTYPDGLIALMTYTAIYTAKADAATWRLIEQDEATVRIWRLASKWQRKSSTLGAYEPVLRKYRARLDKLAGVRLNR